jgi:hypothetical protein
MKPLEDTKKRLPNSSAARRSFGFREAIAELHNRGKNPQKIAINRSISTFLRCNSSESFFREKISHAASALCQSLKFPQPAPIFRSSFLQFCNFHSFGFVPDFASSFLNCIQNGFNFPGAAWPNVPPFAFQMHAPKNSLGRFKGWDEPRSLFAIFALSAVKKFCWFVSIREIRVSFGSGYARLGSRVSDFRLPALIYALLRSVTLFSALEPPVG